MEAGGGLSVGCGFFVLVNGLLGLLCDEDGEKRGSSYWVECVEVVSSAWATRAAREMSMDCVALLIDVHSNIE